jgi:hypothetical protein
MPHTETDYFVIGAGAAGMAFADSLLSETEDIDILMVDRRDRPGGHWNDAYPFVRLHQPAAYYGVNSRMLGNDEIERSGPNSGMYEQSNAGEICDYFHRILHETLLPSDRVRFFGMSDHVGEIDGHHRIVSRLTGEITTVSVRRSVVDARYQETAIPKTHRPGFEVASGATCIPVNDLVGIQSPPDGFVILGSGKTAMDACSWLLRNGVRPDAITWIRPRDAWLLNRAWAQPLEMVSSIMDAASFDLAACATADSIDDVFEDLEASGRLLRIDRNVWPTMYRCATISEKELEELRTIENVVRMGRVIEIGTDGIDLDQGSIPTTPNTVHVDCTAGGLKTSAARPVFEPGRITIQQIRVCQPTFNAALIAFVEAHRDTDEEKNALCPPNQYPDSAIDMLRGLLVQARANKAWSKAPDVLSWLERSRLNAVRGVANHLDESRMQRALARYTSSIGPAVENIERMLATTEG